MYVAPIVLIFSMLLNLGCISNLSKSTAKRQYVNKQKIFEKAEGYKLTNHPIQGYVKTFQNPQTTRRRAVASQQTLTVPDPVIAGFVMIFPCLENTYKIRRLVCKSHANSE